ncbi:hypothetical protein M0R45_036146 [Rubus argutus]|uniref:Uncharacterized protein n=1 Tax=Rubus argutus TaxID=59490 RepID=A0AAW1VYZ0_RUBAR
MRTARHGVRLGAASEGYGGLAVVAVRAVALLNWRLNDDAAAVVPKIIGCGGHGVENGTAVNGLGMGWNRQRELQREDG